MMMFVARVSPRASFILHKNTVSYYSSVSAENSKTGTWERFYKNFTGFSKLEKTEDDALFVENSYLSNKQERSHCWQMLLNSQKDLENLHCKLDPIPVHDRNYANLIKDEDALIKKIRSLSLDFALYNKVTQDSIRSFTSTAEECFNRQTQSEKRAIRLRGIMLLSGVAVGSLLAFVLSNIKYAFPGDETDKSYMTRDMSEILAWIQKQNSKLSTFTKDLWNILGRNYWFLVDENYTGDNVKTSFDDPLLEMDVSDIILQNQLMLKEMQSVESAISNVREFKKLPGLILLADQNDKIGNEGLWMTTLVYGATAVLLPITLLFI